MFRKYDKIFATSFVLATCITIFLFFTNDNFIEWSFTRHQNILSWYIRPLFIIPIMIGALRKSYTVIFGSIFICLQVCFGLQDLMR